MLNKAVINLNAIRQNALKIKEKLGNTKLCAVVKADAYGHGLERVSNALYTIADCYAVALPEEGRALRLSGVDKDILLLSPVQKEQLTFCIENDFTLTVDGVERLLSVDNCARRLRKKAKVHIKVNTGMNRLGIDVKELPRLLDYAINCSSVYIDGVYSHLGNPQDDFSLTRATDKFLLANSIVKGYNNKATAHLSASGGFLRGKYFDMVRIGILLYGYKPFPCDFEVEKAMRVYSPIVTSRNVKKGESLLYGDYTLSCDKPTSIIRYGYADGLPRKMVDGQLNNRCMDLSAVDGISTKKFYPVMTNALEIAEKYQTIPYEILTKCAIRAQKIYVD